MESPRRIRSAGGLSLRIAICLLALTIGAFPAHAVNPGEVSWTAEGVTAYRAIAALDPDPKVRNPDDLAQKLVDPGYWENSVFRLDFAADKKIIDKYKIGIYYYVNARTHHIDATLRGAVSSGARQVVNLGAGYDSRACRFGKQMPQVTFFELDLPATIAEKKRRVRAALGSLPERVAFIPIDFNTETLENALKRAGFDPRERTFFIWEGVTYYISEAAVDSTLRYVARTKPGSSIVFDYIHREIAEGKFFRYPKAIQPAKRVAKKGEPWIFGLTRQEAARFTARCGLKVLSDMGSKRLRSAYLIRSDGTADGTPAAYFRILFAEVPFTPVDLALYRNREPRPEEQRPSAPKSGSPEKAGAAPSFSAMPRRTGDESTVAGTWRGTDSMGGKLEFVFKADGTFTAKRSGGRDPSLKTGGFSISGADITGKMADIRFSGRLSGRTLTGDWVQDGGFASADFTLKRAAGE